MPRALRRSEENLGRGQKPAALERIGTCKTVRARIWPWLSDETIRSLEYVPSSLGCGRGHCPVTRALKSSRHSHGRILPLPELWVVRVAYTNPNLVGVCVDVVPWSEFPIVPSFPHYPQESSVRVTKHPAENILALSHTSWFGLPKMKRPAVGLVSPK